MSTRSTFEFSGRVGLQIAALGSLIGSGAFHWMVQSQMTSNVAVALAFTTIFVLFPVVAAGFVFPTSPAGMLLMRIKLRTWGYGVLVIAGTFVIGYDAYLMNAWWLTQDVMRTSGYVLHQVVLSIIGFHILPGLLVSQVSTTEMIETIRQAHLVKRYKEQTAAEMTILRTTTMRAVELSQRGMSNLNDGERDELARIMVGLVSGIDNTLNDVAASVHGVSSVDIGYTGLLDEPKVANNLHVAVRYLRGGRDERHPLPETDRGNKTVKGLSFHSGLNDKLNDGHRTPRDRANDRDRGQRPGENVDQPRAGLPISDRPSNDQAGSGDHSSQEPRRLNELGDVPPGKQGGGAHLPPQYLQAGGAGTTTVADRVAVSDKRATIEGSDSLFHWVNVPTVAAQTVEPLT